MKIVFLGAIASLLGTAVIVTSGCGGTGSPTTAQSTDDLASSESDVTCGAAPLPASHLRKVIVNIDDGTNDHPGRCAVLDLLADGTLRNTGVTFDLPSFSAKHIAFTPDGRLGLVPQDDGAVGVFRFADDGSVSVLGHGQRLSVLPFSITMAPSSRRAYAPSFDLESQGLYAFDVGCDGRLTDRGRVLPAVAQFLAFLPSGDRAVLVGSRAASSIEGEDTFLLDIVHPSLLGQGVTAGGRPGTLEFSSLAVTPDGRYALVADRSAVTGNRVGVVNLDTMYGPASVDVHDPQEVIASVFGNAAMVISEDDASIYHLSYTPDSTQHPFKITGSVPLGGDVEDPNSAVQITTGPLMGRVLVADGNTVRQLQFSRDGSLAEVSRLVVGGPHDSILAIGVQP